MSKPILKYFLIGMIASFVVVYGSAILLLWTTGEAFIDGDIGNLNYAYLSIFIGLGIGASTFIPAQQQLQPLMIGGLLFTIIFSSFHIVSVWNIEQVNEETLLRTLIVLPITAFLIMAAARIGASTKCS